MFKFNIGWAVRALKAGDHVRRKSWEGGKYLKLYKYDNTVGLYSPQGRWELWRPTVDDFLAEDWARQRFL